MVTTENNILYVNKNGEAYDLLPKRFSGSKPSKNQPTIEQLNASCRHVEELLALGMTMNHAIRNLELHVNTYARLLTDGTGWQSHNIELWSIEALKFKGNHKGKVIIEHGTPLRAFTLMVLELFRNDNLTIESIDRLVDRYWKLAVITKEENARLNKNDRSKMYNTPEERWAASNIFF